MTRRLVRSDAVAMVEGLELDDSGINTCDACGWTALHWAALDEKKEHVAALLDSGADATLASTKVVFHAQNGNNGDRSAGTLAEDLARYPHAGKRCGAQLAFAHFGTWENRAAC